MDTANTTTKQQVLENIYKLIIEYHNPNLVKPNESPNGNLITHIYSDGEITEQKGGFAYLQRSERTIKCPISNRNISTLEFDITKFPKIKETGTRSKFGYAIVLERNAYEIRNEMLRLL